MIVKVIEIIAIVLGIIFVLYSLAAIAKKGSSVYKNKPDEQNPFEGKKVIFVEDKNDEVNADGVRGHLEEAGVPTYQPRFYEKYVKRILDIILSFGGLVILSPIYALIILAIQIDDPGEVFFIQKRVGKNKQYFKLHKFRSMKMCTPHDVPTHMLENPEQYITRVGKFLRAHSLDELPQIWDIFIGNMSVIGPRPGLWNQDVLTAERDKYDVNDVKPGLTGWAQINGRDELELTEKARFDGEYVKKISLLMDIKCFFGSLGVFAHDDSVVEGGTCKLKKANEKRMVVLSSHTPSLFWFRMDMMKKFSLCGYKVFALGNEEEEAWVQKFEEHGIVYKKIDVERNGINPWNDIKTFISIKKCLAEINPDKMFSFQAKTIIYGGLAAKSLGIKEVYPLIAGIGSVFLKDDLKTKLIRQIMKVEYKVALRKCPAIFFQNKDDVKIFKENHILGNQKIAMLHGSGVNLERFTVQSLPDKVAFLCISRLIRDKGVNEYLEACKMIKERYPDIRCMLVGPFDSNPSAIKSEELQKFIDAGIEYYGEQSDVRPYLAQCSVFVLPSYREGTPKTVLEAMASGRAIVTTDAPGCRETVIDGKNGILVETKNIDNLYKAMEKFIFNPELAKDMGIKGRKTAETIFDVKLVNKEICKTMNL